ncbi:MAG: hypothetical protein H6983_00410 [Ectothiorhodospiraceae bacterium]|nr:hypothetical protein [Ectothiorhodospiraceae bacterium]
MLEVLDTAGLVAWIAAAASAMAVQRYMRSRGWTVLMVGACLVVLRQLLEFAPGYAEAATSASIPNVYMLRYLVGGAAAVVLLVGVMMLWQQMVVTRTLLEGGDR